MQHRAHGFSYIGLLLLIAIAGVGMAAVGQVWHTEVKRENERELLFVGEQFRQAIASYYQSSIGDSKQYPASLEDLLLDHRLPVPRHHLRKIYRDPFTGSTEWGLIKLQGRITGVYSLSAGKPLKRTGFPAEYEGFADAASYKDWRFSYSVANNLAVGTTATPTETIPAEAVGGNAAQSSSRPAVAVPETRPAPDPSTKPNDVYADCAKQMENDNASCRSSCGDFSGEGCRSCINQAFQRYRACIALH